MDNAQKAIMIGVGLFITIIIIAAVMLITGMGQNLLNKGQSQVSGISESLMNDLVTKYDGKIMSGSQVRTAAVQLLNSNDSSIRVYIKKKGASSSTEIKAANNKTATQVLNETLSGKDTTNYKGSVSYSEKKTAMINFTEQ